MPASNHLKVLSVRLPEAEIRRLKSLAVSKGVSVQEAVHQALASWPSQVVQIRADSLDALQGSLAGIDVMGLMRGEKKAELVKDKHRSHMASLTPDD
jgi:hypothetical protein